MSYGHDEQREYAIRILLQMCYNETLRNQFMRNETCLIAVLMDIYAQSKHVYCECILRQIGVIKKADEQCKVDDLVFISHDFEDIEFTRQIAVYLERVGLKCYFNPINDVSTYNFERVFRLIEKSYCFVIGNLDGF